MPHRALAAVTLFLASVALAQNREALQTSTSAIPVTGKYRIDQILELAVAEGQLQGRFMLDLADQVQPYRFEAVDAGDWVVRKRMLGASSYITITRYDFEAPIESFWTTALTLRSNYLYITATSGDTMSGMMVRLTQSGGTLRLQVTEKEKGVQKTVLSATAATMRELQATNPREVRQYLVPMVRRLTGRNILKPGATDVYRVFDKIEPEATNINALDELIIKLEADAFKEREEASKKLLTMGAPLVLAALRRDTTELSAEAKNRLDVFLAENSTGGVENVEAARKDLPFLIDCLDDEDVKVRQAAKAGVEAVLGSRIDFDPAADADARNRAIDALRAKHDKPVKGATRPAVTPNRTLKPDIPKPAELR